jgi:hypothetical protein
MAQLMNILVSRTLKALLVLLITLSIAQAQLVPNLGGQRAGISAFQFLKIGVGARGVGLGETFVAIANDASALYWNPAGITQFPENQVLIAHSEYVIDLKHEFLGATYHLSPNDALGFSMTSLHTEDMPITTETQPFGTGEYFKFGDIAFGLTYGRKMTDQFSFGITGKYVEETLDILKMRGIMIDLGTYYWTGIGSSRFAVVVSNFGGDVSPSGEITEFNGNVVNSFQSFSPPTQFKIGFAMEPLETEDQRITSSIELNHPNDNSENIHLGVEYQYEKSVWLRTGVKRTIGEPFFGRDNTSSNDITFGVGFAIPVAASRINVDYAFANFNQLGNVHRISLAVTY